MDVFPLEDKTTARGERENGSLSVLQKALVVWEEEG